MFEDGKKPMSNEEKGQSEKARWARLLQLAEEGTWDKIKEEYPKESIIHGQRLMALHRPECVPINGSLEHEWWVGPTGTGKSRLAWELYPKHYAKPLNKWWDGYQFEEIVIIEEWAPRNECTASALKQWADRYPFTCEVKGAVLPKIRPRKLIVLSNYTIEQCFPQKEDCDPLLRRFKVLKFPEDKPWARSWAGHKHVQPSLTLTRDNIPLSMPEELTPPPELQPPVQNPEVKLDIENLLFGESDTEETDSSENFEEDKWDWSKPGWKYPGEGKDLL